MNSNKKGRVKRMRSLIEYDSKTKHIARKLAGYLDKRKSFVASIVDYKTRWERT